MSSVGETLRRERLRTGLDLEKISQDTKISVRMLELIEADQFEKLPGGVFARSFVRQYARAVGADEEELVRELERMLEPASEPLPAAEAAKAPQPEFHVPPVAQWGGASRFRSGSSLPALALVVMVILACSAAYTWWQKSRHTPPVSVQATEKPVAQPSPVTPPATANSASPSAPSAAPTATEPVPPAISAQADGGALTIALTAAEATWVRATANGKVMFSGILQPNETKSLSADEPMTLRIGNAGGVAISLNGKSIPAVGPKGQVRTVQLSPDGGVQVVEPVKVPPPQPTQTL